jgi:hypothetical protein
LTTHPTNLKGGGIRISKVSSFSDATDSKPVITEYLYVSGYRPGLDPNALVSSGILSGKNQYIWTNFNPKVYDDNVKKIGRYIISAQSIFPLSVNGASCIGYSEIVERKNNGSYTIYKFTNFKSTDGNHFDEKPFAGTYNDISPYITVSDRSLERGKLLSTEYYTSSGNPVKTVKVNYKAYNNRFVKSLSLNANSYSCGTDDFKSYQAYPYKVYNYRYLKYKEEETTYNSDGITGIKESAEFSHTFYTPDIEYCFLREEKKFVVGNSSYVSTKYRYPNEFLNNGLLTSMVNSYNMNGVPVETIYKRDDKVIGAEVISFVCKNCTLNPDGVYTGGMVKPSQVYRLETSIPLSNYQEASSNFTLDTRCKPSLFFDEYDNFGNILQLRKNINTKSSYIWGYKNLLPIAEVSNSAVDRVAFSSFETDTDLGNWTYTSTTPAYYSTDAKTGTRSYYLYSSGASHTITKKALPIGNYIVSYWAKGTGNVLVNGTNTIPVTSKWTYQEVKVNLITAKDLPVVGTGTSVIIDELRIYPQEAQMISYTYNPVSGITSSSDVNGVTTYYEYDGLQRLKLNKIDNGVEEKGTITEKIQYHYGR